MHRKWLCAPTVLLCLLAQQGVARNIFITPGEAGTGVSTCTVDPLSCVTTVGPVTSAFSVVGVSPTKHYVISRNSTDSVVALEGRFPVVTVGARISLGGTPAAAAITADGRFLAVAGTSGIAIIEAASDRATTLMGNIDVGGEANDVAADIDGARVFVISSSSSRLTAIDTASRQSTATVSLPSRPTAVTMGPNGILYVSAQNAVYEINATTLAIRATIPVVGSPGKLQFTPNGRFAVSAATAAAGGRGVYLINLATRGVSDLPQAAFALTDVTVAGNNLAYGVTSTGSVYVINIGNDGVVTASTAAFTGAGVPSAINDVESSGELSGPKYVVLSSAGYLYRLEIASNSTGEGVLKPSTGSISVVTPPGAGGAVGHIAYNETQTAAAGTASQPLVVRVYDANGLPVSGVQVVFSTSTPGATLSNTTVTSNNAGFASTRVTVPAGATGAITVNASIQQGQRNTTFTVNVGDPNLPGPGTGGPGGTPGATGLQVVSGNGAVVSAQFATLPGVIRVRLLDNAGLPVSGATITWTLEQGGGNFPGGTTSSTDSNGEATTTFFASPFQPGVSYQLNVIRATASTGQSQTLNILAVPLLPNQGGAGAIDPLWPTDRNITLRVGEVRQGAIQVRASIRGTSFPAPFVGLRLIDPVLTDPTAPSIQCRGGIVLTDQNGLASCDLVANSRTIFPVSVTAILGEVVSQTFVITVEQGLPAEVRVISGNNQTVLQGQTTQPFVVEVRDPAGNVLRDVAVAWDFPPFFPTPPTIQRTTDFNGRASASFLVPTDRSGPFTIRATANNITATFNLTVNVAAAGINAASGSNQIAVVGQAFAQPLQARVTDAQGRPVANATVTFTVSTGSATVNPATATTNADGLASTTVTAGTTAGPVTIAATSGSQATTFNLTVRLAGAVFTSADFLNAAGFQAGVSPGSIAYIRATGVAPTIRGSVTPASVVGPLPTKLSDVEVLFNNVLAPIYAVSNVNGEESVIVQVPHETAPGTANVTIRTAGGGTNTVPVTILPIKPGVFTYTDVNGATYAVATRPDGSYISAANPARRGEEIRVYATGLGQTSPGTATNRAGIAGQAVSASIIGGINNAGVRVRSAELLPGSVGVYVVTLEIPSDTATGSNQPLGLGATGTDGQVVFANAAFIPIV